MCHFIRGQYIGVPDIWREWYLICHESTKTPCNATVSCYCVIAAIQRNDSHIASLTEAGNIAVWEIVAHLMRELNGEKGDSQPSLGCLCRTNYKDRWTHFPNQQTRGTTYIDFIRINFQKFLQLLEVLLRDCRILLTSLAQWGRRRLNGGRISSTRVVRINTADAGEWCRRNLDLRGRWA